MKDCEVPITATAPEGQLHNNSLDLDLDLNVDLDVDLDLNLDLRTAGGAPATQRSTNHTTEHQPRSGF